MRAALAGEVGQEHQPLGAGLDPLRLADQVRRSPRRRRGAPATSSATRPPTASPPSGGTHPAPRGRTRARAPRVGRELFAVREQHAAGADRRRDRPLTYHADTDRGGRVVAAPGGDRQPARQPELLGDSSRTVPVASGPSYTRGIHSRGIPSASRISPDHSRARTSSSSVPAASDASVARSPVSWTARSPSAAARCDPRVGVRLVARQPQDLRRLKPGERGVAGELEQPLRTDALGDLVALGRRPLVVPQQRRPDHRAGRIEEDGAVHLAGDAEPGDLAGGRATSASTSLHASHHSAGCCSVQPGRGVSSSCGRVASATSSPSVVTASARVPLVPTSTPTRTATARHPIVTLR